MLTFVLFACQENNLHKVEGPDVEPVIMVNPETLTFGGHDPGTEVTDTFTVENLGPGPVTLQEIQMVGTTAFEVMTPVTSFLLEEGEILPIDVTYSPLSLADAGTAVVFSDAVNDRTSVGLRGEAIMPQLLIEPQSLSFESDEGETVTHHATLTNEGTADLVIETLYAEGPGFAFEAELPMTLAPGEASEVPVHFTPTAEGEADGTLWVQGNVGDGTVDLQGDWRLCTSLPEAWDRGWMTMAFTAQGHELTNLSDQDVCISQWSAFITETSQDAAIGDRAMGDSYEIEMGPGQTLVFDYEPSSAGTGDPVWMCIEETQVTTPTTNFWFFGAEVPRMLRNIINGGGLQAQDNVWDAIADNPIMLVGRDNHAWDAEVGDVTQQSVIVMNLGRQRAQGQVTETVPWFLQADNFDIEPDVVEVQADTTRYIWNVTLDRAIDTDTNQHTIYDILKIGYDLEVLECPGARNAMPAPMAEWADEAAFGSAGFMFCSVD